MSTTYLIALLAYFALMIGISFWFSRSSSMSDGDDYVLAGRSLPTPVLAGTLLATFVGSGTIIGGASFVYQYGPIAGIFFFLGTFVGIIVLGAFAPRLQKNGFHTIPEFFQERFGHVTARVGTVLVLIAFVGITAYQFTGAGGILASITPLSSTQGTIIAALIISFLALSGGLKSVAWTDAISALIIITGLLATLYFVFSHDLGSVEAYVNGLSAEHKTITGSLNPLMLLGYFLPLFLLILGDQNIHQRMAAGNSAKTVRSSVVMFFVGAILVIFPVILLASSATILTPDGEPDMAVLGLAAEGLTPTGIAALLMVAALALIITTGSSYLLTCAGNLVYDFIYPKSSKREATGKQKVRAARFSTLGIAVVAYILVQFFPGVLELQMYAYTMYGATITPVIVAALFWKKANGAGAVASMITGGIATIFWETLGDTSSIRSVVIALPVSVVTLFVVSLATAGKRSAVKRTPVK